MENPRFLIFFFRFNLNFLRLRQAKENKLINDWRLYEHAQQISSFRIRIIVAQYIDREAKLIERLELQKSTFPVKADDYGLIVLIFINETTI